MTNAKQTRHSHLVTVLTEVARATTRSVDLRELFGIIHDAIRRLVRFDGLALGVISDADCIEGSLAVDGEIEPLALNNAVLVNWVRSVERTLTFSDNDVPNDHILTLLRRSGFRRSLHVPLTIDGETIGFLAAMRRDHDEFDASDHPLLESVGDFVAVAIRNRLLFQRAERARLEADVRLQQLESLDRVTQRLATQAGLEQALAVIGDELWRLLPFVSCQIWELSPGRDQLVAIQTWGAHGNLRPRPMLPAGTGIIGDVIARKTAAFVPDATADPRSRYPAEFDALKQQLFDLGESVMAAPLTAAGEVLGGLLMSRLGRGRFSADDFRLFSSFAGQIALALRGVRMSEENRELFLATIRSLASLVDQREAGGNPHSDRVAYLSEAIATELRLPPREVELVRIAATLHDAGKIGIPENVLVKPDPLSDEERALLMTHPALGASMVQAHGTHPDIVPLIRHHHEWYDGRGYPDGLAGDDIPLGAAIISSAEAFERITSDMPYRAARSTTAAKHLLVAGSGQQFHPDIVEATLRVIAGFEDSSAPYLRRIAGHAEDSDFPILTLVEQQEREVRPPGTFRILYKIAHEIGAIPELTRFLRQIAQIIGAEMSVGACTIFLLERDSGDLVAAGSYPDATESTRVRPVDGPLVAAVRAAEPLTLAAGNAPEGRYMVPLLTDGEPIGAIVVDAAGGRRFRDSERSILGAIAGQIATAIGVAQQHDDARRGAITDGMTGTHNYRYLMERLTLELERDAQVSLMLIDMDSLKALNDVAGHLAGDALLRAVATSLASGVRRS
ncbi:MAG: GAF domain-containing protein, partial [Chloroflexota bacterium]|nr:GAF domain-containing protein [Chloroflexota bacterium]